MRDDLEGCAERPPNRAAVVVLGVEHQLLPVTGVQRQKTHQAVCAVLCVGQQLAREVAVEVLDPATDRPRFLEPGEGVAEGSEVDFERPAVDRTLVLDQRLLETEVLRHRDLVDLHRLGLNPEVGPATDSRSDGKIEPWVLHRRLL